MSLSALPEVAQAVQRGAPWLTGGGAEADVVISSRVRMARNIAGYPFLTKTSRSQRIEILNVCKERLLGAGIGERTLWVDVHDASPLDRTLMVERHLISKEHARGVIPGTAKEDQPESIEQPKPSVPTMPPARGVAISFPDEMVSVMVNEEDHLRLQVLSPGLALGAALDRVNQVDDRVEGGGAGGGGGLEYAFSTRFGYLTACPTNVGTGVRVSVMLHLPALKLTGEMEKVRRATRDMSIAVRGYYGEGSEAAGELYQVSNQTTLGKPESVILHEIEKEIVPQIVQYERAARKVMMTKRRRILEDRVYRALGTLRTARLLTPEEAITMLSDVRLGIVCGLISDVPEQTVNQLILSTQPAHLQRLLGREMDQNERREARADMVRQRVGGA